MFLADWNTDQESFNSLKFPEITEVKLPMSLPEQMQMPPTFQELSMAESKLQRLWGLSMPEWPVSDLRPAPSQKALRCGSQELWPKHSDDFEWPHLQGNSPRPDHKL